MTRPILTPEATAVLREIASRTKQKQSTIVSDAILRLGKEICPDFDPKPKPDPRQLGLERLLPKHVDCDCSACLPPTY